MKRVIAIAIMAAVLGLTPGCTTTRTDPTTGEIIKEFDPVKTQAILAPLENIIAEVVVIGSEKDPNTESALRITSAVLASIRDNADIDRTAIQERVNNIQISGLTAEQAARVKLQAVNLVLKYYDIGVQYVLAAEVAQAKAIPLILDTIRGGIDLGLLMVEAKPPSP